MKTVFTMETSITRGGTIWPASFFIPCIITAALLVLSSAIPVYSQEARLSDKNAIAWFVYTGNFKVAKRFSVHTEFQWRRVNSLRNGQQNLLRTGLVYALRKDISLQAGYAYAESFVYGDYPAAASFPEHRFFEQALIQNPIGNNLLTHRFTVEQRFIGKPVISNGNKSIDYFFVNRFRYRLRAERPLARNSRWSIALQDELFIGWGKNTGANIFDQNRLALLLSCKPNAFLRLEGGYLNQVLQQGKRINEKAVFQYNHGFQLAAHITFDLSRKHPGAVSRKP